MKNKNLWRKWVSSLAFLSLVSAANAEALIVEQRNGEQQTTKTSYELGDKPVLTFNENRLVVKTNVASAEFEIANVVKYYFAESDLTGQENSDAEMGYVYVTEEGVKIEKFAPFVSVSLFGVTGQLIKTYQTSADGSLEITLSDKAKGIYLVKTNNTTIKVIK